MDSSTREYDKSVQPLKSGELVNRRVDSWLVGWFAVALWALILIGREAGVTLPAPALTTLFWISATINAAHFGLSYHLAYGPGGATAVARRMALLWFPMALAGTLVAFALAVRATHDGAAEARVAGALVTTVFLLTGWHYVKQTYGIGRVGLALVGMSINKSEADTLRFGLYPLWVLNAAQMLVGTQALDGYVIGYGLLPAWSIGVLRTAAACATIPILVVLIRLARRGRVPGILLASYVASLAWFVAPVNAYATAIALPGLHALQYLAIGHRAEIGLAAARERPVTAGWWLNIFVGVAAGGLLASRWLPGLVDRHLDPAAPLLASACIFVFLNLHHYLLDATIWKSGGSLVRAVVARPAPADTPVPSGH
jgi:hypothetical protein